MGEELSAIFWIILIAIMVACPPIGAVVGFFILLKSLAG